MQCVRLSKPNEHKTKAKQNTSGAGCIENEIRTSNLWYLLKDNQTMKKLY